MECDFSERSKFFGIKFLVDPEDFEKYVKGYSFSLNKGYVMYSCRTDGLNKKLLHRIIMGEPESMLIDHINRNPLDNRRSNLRICTHQQNQCNRGKQSNNTSGFKGVCWHKGNQKWVAEIRINGKCKHLGYFDDPEEAHQTYIRTAQKLHGDFANFG